MSNLLAVFDPGADPRADAAIIAELAPHRPDRVTVLITGAPGALAADGPEADAVRDRLARLLTAIELRTGAAVSGLVGDADGLDAPYDRVIGGTRVLVAA